jgi:putative copper export protein
MIWLDWQISGTRFINFAGSILLAAVVGFYLLANSSDRGSSRSEFFPARLILYLAVVTGLAQAAWLLELFCSLHAGMGGDPLDECETFLFGTQFGKIGLLRCGVLFVLVAYRAFWLPPPLRYGATSFDRRRLQKPGNPSSTTLLESALIFGQLALLAWFSHAAAVVGPLAWIQLGDDLLHLIGAAIWPGGLLPLWLLLQKPVAAMVKREALLRFSNISVVVAPLVGVTGVLSAYFRMHGLAPLITTPYGRYVLLKVACFFALLALGAVNRFRLIPGLVRSSAEIRHSPETWWKLRRNILIEQILFVVILFAVARLGLLPPP